MAATGGFIQLHRKIVEWEWYKNLNTFRVFLHCLLMANFTDGRFEGKEIKRGQFVTSLQNLSVQTSLSVRQVRVALDHLIVTGELTSESYSKYRIITVVKYDIYQQIDKQIDNQMTSKRQADDKQVTSKGQQYNNDNKGIMEKGNNNPLLTKREVFTPPTVEDVERYCEEKGIYGFDAAYFVDYYGRTNWYLKNGQRVRDWKACVRTWLRNDEKKRQEKYDAENPLPY